MSSRFVSSGTIDAETGKAVAPPAPPPVDHNTAATLVKKDEWRAVQQELEAERREREQQRQAAAQQPERSLFEVLQANKEAKQAAMDEAHSFRNQFRALDDDEVRFLEGVKASQRAAEERVRRETEEGLEAFRAARALEPGVAEEGRDGEEELAAEESWAAAGAGRKRRREREKERDRLKGVKRRASEPKEGTTEVGKEKETATAGKVLGTKDLTAGETKAEDKSVPAVVPPPKAKAGLVDYGSSDDEDD